MKLSREIKDSITLKFAELARQKNKDGEKIISLGIGEPEFETPNEIIDKTISAMNNGFTRYSNSRGLFELRKSLADKFNIENGILIDPENIVVTSGAKQAMVLSLMSILEPNDEVINFSPSYVSYVPQIKIAEPKAIIHNFDLSKTDFSVDWELFSQIVNKKTKAIIINSPNNPSGKMFTQKDFSQLVKIIEKNNCYLLSDEIYEKFIIGDINHISPGSFESIKDYVITINGFSKSFSMTGWRVGYLSANKSIVKNIVKLVQHINTNTVTFIQKGLCNAYKTNNPGLKKFNHSLRAKVDYMLNTFTNEFSPPNGGIFSFLNINNTGLDSDEFATQLLSKYNVAVTPGIGFGNNWDDHIRISLVIDDNAFFEGIDCINDFILKNK